MTNRRTMILAALVALALAGGPPVAVATDGTGEAPDRLTAAGQSTHTGPATTLEAVEVSAESENGAAVVLRANGPLDYESFVLERPDRLVVDLKGVVSRLVKNQLAVGSGGVLRVRAGQYRVEPVPVARVVFDLEAALPHRIDVSPDGLRVRFGLDESSSRDGESEIPADDPVAEALASVGFASSERASTTESPTPASVPIAAQQEPSPAAEFSQPTEAPASEGGRAIAPDALESLLRAPALAAPAESEAPPPPPVPSGSFETRTIVTGETQYTGKRISLNLVDADVKQVFRLFHEISGLNFVLDPSVDGRVTIVLDNVPWDQALDIILTNNGFDKALENNVIRIATTQKLAQEAASRRQLKEAKELEVEPITITRTLSYAKAREVERVIRDGGVLSARGKVIVDERTNTLIISDISKKVEPLDQLISTLDSETPQVMIEARIVETSREFVQDFGVRWGMQAVADASRGTATNLAFPHNASMRYGLNLPGGGGASALNFRLGNILDSFTLDVTLNALETEGRGRILSSPRIATQNNERAEIEQGIRIPIVNTTATEINVEFVSASLRLSVTPQITAEGTIVLDIQVENNSPDFVNRVGTTPPINTQRAQTKVLISDGGTTVIGGIFTVNESRSESGVPWFRKIPALGWLFKARNITNENRELLIFITPKIMRVS